MKMAELSSTTGVSVATIKYYLREGLLASGERTLPNQASYGEEHVRRIRLIKSLIDIGGLSVASAREVIGAIDSDIPLFDTFGVAQKTVSDELDPSTIDPESLAGIDELMSGWYVLPTNPGRIAAARILTTYRSIVEESEENWFSRYAVAALLAAEADIDELDTREGRESKAETVVIGTVLGDALFAALRRAAQEHVVAKRYGMPTES